MEPQHLGRRGTQPGLRAIASALAILVLTACSDGYPTEDVAHTDPSSMGTAELLAALNALSRDGHSGGSPPRYALSKRCELEIIGERGTEGRKVGIDGATVHVRTADGISEIQLVADGRDTAQAVTVLRTRRWSDTVRAKSLLMHLEVLCSKPMPAA